MKKILLCLGIAGVLLFGWKAYDLIFPDEPPAAAVVVEEPKQAELYVHITGAVQKPGLYSFPKAVRIGDAVHAAGDAVVYADLSNVNYAEEIHDGLHVHIPYNLEGVPSAQGNQININEAGEEELVKLPGVGPAMAKKIIAYRTEQGLFTSVEDIKKVKGIGNAKYNKLKELICI
jgi:competence protein ComEA